MELDKIAIDNYKKAGAIARTVREEAKKMVKPGLPLIELADALEKKIREAGGVPAWPVNISINEVAAHYSPSKDDESKIKEGDLVKVDIGVAIDGYIADTSVSVALDENDQVLVEAAEKALDEAIKLVKPGADVADISAKIAEVISDFGVKPIVNLTGHGLDQYVIHTEPKIPNHAGEFHYILEEGEVIAIEPFTTRGRNFINESDFDRALTYTLAEEKPVRSPEARKVIQEVRDRRGMPFTNRWLSLGGIKLRIAMKELTDRECIHAYRILKGDSKIAQAEHTVLVLKEPIVITR
ncbi:MAG: type II methionyl aminopeptidase [Candidatus Aenigmatarchaeota archaeon]